MFPVKLHPCSARMHAGYWSWSKTGKVGLLAEYEGVHGWQNVNKNPWDVAKYYKRDNIHEMGAWSLKNTIIRLHIASYASSLRMAARQSLEEGC